MTRPRLSFEAVSGRRLALGGLMLAVGCLLLGVSVCKDGLTPESIRAAGKGSIQVNSTPIGATVFLDTAPTGKITDCLLLDVTSGSHTVKLTLSGYADWYKTVDVAAGQTVTVETTLVASVGSLNISSVPAGAVVWLDGWNTGQVTNCVMSSIASGNHQVKLTLNGYVDWDSAVSVNQGQETRVDATLARATGSIHVSSIPIGAAVWLDRASTGETTECRLDGVLVGDHQVTLKLAGKLDWDTTVSVVAGQTVAVACSLLPCDEVGYYDTPGNVQGVAVAGSYAYVADGDSGLRIIDVSNPQSPFAAGWCSTPGLAMGVAVAGSHAYVTDWGAGLRIIDVSNPQSPFEAGYFDTPGLAIGVAVAGSHAYVMDGDSGLRIIDVSNPQSSFEAGYCNAPGLAQGVAVAGSHAYVADGHSGLRIIDISNPQNPFEAGYCDTPGNAMGIAVAGSYAYVADGDLGLRIIDVSNPQSPFEVGQCNTPGLAMGVAVAGSYAYVADGDSGLRIIDISNPQSPFEAGYCDTPDLAMGVVSAGGYAYVADRGAGLHIVRTPE